MDLNINIDLLNSASLKVLDFVSDAVIISDPQLRIIYLNKAAEGIYGIAFEEYKGKQVLDIAEAEYINETEETAVACLLERGHWEGDLLIRRRDAQVLYFKVAVNSMWDSGGQRIGFIAVNRDVTSEQKAQEHILLLEKKNKELKEVQEKLELAQKQFTAFMEHIPFPAWIIEENGVLLFSNRLFRQRTHLDESNIGKSILSFFSQHIAAEYKKNIRKVVEQEGVVEAIEQIDLPGMGRQTIKSYKFPLFREEGQPQIGGVSINLTEQVQRQEALEQSNQRFVYATRATSDAIWEWNLKTNTIFLGQNFADIFGYAEQETDLAGRFNLIHPEDRENSWMCLKGTLNSTTEKCQTEYRFLHQDGSYRYVRDRSFILRDENGSPRSVIGAMQDITGNKQMEEKLKAKEEEKSKAILRAAIEAQERERAELSALLHENINQTLTSCKLLLAELDCDQDARRVAHCNSLLQESIDNIRSISHRINPHMLQVVGLVDALQELVQGSSGRTGIHMDATGFEEEPPIPAYLQLVVYRIVQEQINNIVKHAKASSAEVTLKRDRYYMTITITDNGVGFDIHSPTMGLGLANIRHRAEMHHATFILNSKAGYGTTLQVMIPLFGQIIS